jgi:hypothetical protein
MFAEVRDEKLNILLIIPDTERDLSFMRDSVAYRYLSIKPV